jgi:hypothetical protein
MGGRGGSSSGSGRGIGSSGTSRGSSSRSSSPRTETQRLAQSFRGKTVTNHANAIGKQLNIVGVRHTGNFAFEGVTMDGQRVVIYTTPTKGRDNMGYPRSLKIDGIYPK